MTNEQIERGLNEYVRRYKAEKQPIHRERISREVGLYLANVTENERDFQFYASEFVCRTHQLNLLEKLIKGLRDWT